MDSQPHFLMIPLMSPGHIIPMVEMAKMLAKRGVTIFILTTPVNALKFNPSITRAIESGLPINLLQVKFPSVEAGLPEGCESVDEIPSFSLLINFFRAIDMWKPPVEQMLAELKPKPDCMIYDKNIPWLDDTGKKFRIPRIIFDGMSCFAQLSIHNLHISRIHETVSKTESFVVPGLPDRIELTKAQLPGSFNPTCMDVQEFRARVRAAEIGAYGVVINTFEELEQSYVNEYKKLRGEKVWCVGPSSLSNKEQIEIAHRGNKAAIDEEKCLEWLDSLMPGSVLYACLGSLSRVLPAQLIELALGLEASNRPFVWVIRVGEKAKELEEWILENGFEKRTKGRGLLIRGWAPQVLILSHPAIGAFLTHCGWNSTLEAVCAGLPMITWPMFAEQFLNEKLVVQVLNIGASVGSQAVVHLGEEENSGVQVMREDVKKAIDKVMDEGREADERRRRAKELGKIANKAIEGGSSYHNITMLIQDVIMKQENLI